ncbi:MAG TPA: PKD domain-containing protein [Conexibacter sp.]|nr:PKD domain-containing protein [Conexibacter sp.]
MKLLCSLIIIVVAALAAASPAMADVTVEGTGEPAFTNSADNTQWIRWQAPAGSDAYRLHARWYRDGAQVTETTWPVSGSGDVTWLNWTGVAALEHGRSYAICVVGEYSLPNDSLFFPDGPNSCTAGTMQGKRTSTTIDRSKPNTSVAAAGGAAFTAQQTIPVSIGFQDDVAGPYPATFVCVKAGADPCEGGYAFSDECSHPAGGGKSTTFNCNVDASELPDGPVTICVVAADASVPNNAGSPDQTRNASQANLSDKQCDTVVLDRQGPSLALNASKTVTLTGEQVAFSADASDSVSGIDTATSSWEFGDGTPAAAGSVASHSFDRPGTYVVSFRAKDKAGNETTAQKSITVEAPPSGGTPSPGDSTPPPSGGTPSPGGSTPPPGGSALPGIRIGGVRVIVPKAVRLGKARQLVLRAQAEQAGVLTLRLTRGKKIYSRLSVGLAPGETTQRLRLPKRLERGTYMVKIAFKATGGSYTAAGTAKVVLRTAS